MAAWLQRLTCPRQRAFAPGHQARYPASYTRPPAEEPGTPPCFPAAFRPPAFASWASCPAREFRPPYGRPTTPPAAARTRTGFPCSARVRPGWLRVPSLPRGRRCPRRPVNLPGRPPAASQRPAPIHPGQQPAPGSNRDEASARVHCRSPHTSLPLTCDPGRNGILGFFPELRTPQGRTRRRTSGRGQARTQPGLRPWHQPASFDVLTHNVRPHVARWSGSVCAASAFSRGWPTALPG